MDVLIVDESAMSPVSRAQLSSFFVGLSRYSTAGLGAGSCEIDRAIEWSRALSSSRCGISFGSVRTLWPISVDPSDVHMPDVGVSTIGNCGVPFDGTSAGHPVFVKRKVCGYTKIKYRRTTPNVFSNIAHVETSL